MIIILFIIIQLFAIYKLMEWAYKAGYKEGKLSKEK